MADLSGSTQSRSNQPQHPYTVQNASNSCMYTSILCISWTLVPLPLCPSAHVFDPSPLLIHYRMPHSSTNRSKLIDLSDTSTVQSNEADRYYTGEFETASTHLPPRIADLSRPEGTHPEGVGFPFEDGDANVPREGEPVFAGSISPNQLFNTVMNENSLAPPISTMVAPNPSLALTTPLQSQALPTPLGNKYQCTGCLKTFDRESRLENCLNRHLGVRPHKCFGACGSTGWYIAPQPQASVSSAEPTVTFTAQQAMRPSSSSTDMSPALCCAHPGGYLTLN